MPVSIADWLDKPTAHWRPKTKTAGRQVPKQSAGHNQPTALTQSELCSHLGNFTKPIKAVLGVMAKDEPNAMFLWTRASRDAKTLTANLKKNSGRSASNGSWGLRRRPVPKTNFTQQKKDTTQQRHCR